MSSNNDFDYILVGQSFLSFLLGESLIESGKKTMILDDERLGFGDIYLGFIGELEKKYLKKWGERYELEPLKNIENYIEQTDMDFIVEKSWLKVGRGPLFNYREMARKYPNLFKNSAVAPWELSEGIKESFDDQVYGFIDRVAELILSQKKLTAESLLAQAPSMVSEMFLSFKSLIDDKESEATHFWQEKTLLYLAKGFFQNKLSLFHSDLDWLHLLISLISPIYRVNQEKLQSDLCRCFLSKGGRLKKTKLSEVQYEKKRPWAVEFESYEGIIRPQNIVLLGGMPIGPEMRLSPEYNVYQGVDVEWHFEEGLPYEVGRGIFIFGDRGRIGTNRPSWYADFTENAISFKVFNHFLHGQKIEFYRDSISEFVRKEILEIFPQITQNRFEEKISFGKEIFLRSDNLLSSKQKVGKTEVISAGPGQKKITLKNTYYFGPYRNGALGLLSSLIDIQEFSSRSLPRC